jgi:hypothetical protein
MSEQEYPTETPTQVCVVATREDHDNHHQPPTPVPAESGSAAAVNDTEEVTDA